MAGHSTQRQKQLSRLAIIIIVVLFAAVLARQLFSKANLHNKHPRARSPQSIIGGRWKAVRASLNLPPLLDTINPSAAILPPSTPLRTGKLPSRFDLRRKRAEADLQSQSRLHLAADVRDAPRVSVEVLAASFRRIAAAEKEMAETRGKHEKSGQKARVRRRIEDWQDPTNVKDVLTTVTND
ncbi:hypothetical protein DEU56DRAFT_328872 [Suillus clintonianus]|uniref:uncharacterized protein n=1 Tax=Suillus clintonianus TaxID=1904413 RepID=UPI001B8823AA|nr:uncharacterized protein DEU56DRAFT_328872 [Suillus clintonianus]KAG2138943.1 hypothetical protein DEU56DRAFT_328872 [Suillus clintonianus]